MSDLHQAFLRRRRIGEGPLFVPKKLTFDQRLGNRGAIERQKGLVFSQAVGVQEIGHQLFARATGSLDEDGGICGCHACSKVQHLKESSVLTDDVRG